MFNVKPSHKTSHCCCKTFPCGFLPRLQIGESQTAISVVKGPERHENAMRMEHTTASPHQKGRLL